MRDEQESAFLALAADIVASLDIVPSPTALLDEQGTIRWQNKASIALRGRRVGKHFSDYVSPGDRQAARAVFERMLADGDSEELAVQVLNAEGGYVGLQGRWSVVSVRDGSKVVVVLSLGDERDPQPVPSTPGPAAELTGRQLEVLRLLAAGRSTAEIAVDLQLSPTTVRNHVANLLAALGVHSRLQAVVAAREAGLLDT